MMWDVGECNKRPGSPFFNRHTMDVRRHSNPVKLASRKGNLNNVHVRVMLTLLTTAMFFLHDALNDTLPCFWNWKVGKPLINLTLADATKIGKNLSAHFHILQEHPDFVFYVIHVGIFPKWQTAASFF